MLIHQTKEVTIYNQPVIITVINPKLITTTTTHPTNNHPSGCSHLKVITVNMLIIANFFTVALEIMKAKSPRKNLTHSNQHL